MGRRRKFWHLAFYSQEAPDYMDSSMKQPSNIHQTRLKRWKVKRYRLWSEARIGMRLEGGMFPCKGMRGYPVQEMMLFDWVAQQLRTLL